MIALITDRLAARFRIFEVSGRPDELKVKELKRPPLAALWREKGKKITLPSGFAPSGSAESIIALSPDNIDVIYSKNGETLRSSACRLRASGRSPVLTRRGSVFERVRRLLNADTWSELHTLVRQLEIYRSPDPPNKRHEFYRSMPEAWLESILRRNIRQLDSNLILSPIYNQFRTLADKIDLLAIRRDGRLIIIELKASPDREMVFQAADYWRKIELQRRSGELERVGAFGEMKILDKPALVYAVAPALSFHRDFGYFAKALRPEAEVWRFELREDWRSRIKVLSRRNYPSVFTNL